MNKYNFGEINNFKLWDNVIFKDNNISGYIDAVTHEKYRVRTNNGYEWVLIGDKNMIHAKALQQDEKEKDINTKNPIIKNKTDFRYLG